METRAVVLEAPGQLALRSLALDAPGEGDVVVDVAWSGVSAGTERLLWSGRMPSFPGMGYPLVPGYESVGRIVGAGPASGRAPGEFVFVPGARCFGAVRGLFGGAAARLVLQGARALPIGEALGEFGVLLALAATAHHVLAGGPPPELIVGHGALGRLLARIVITLGHPVPTVWERDPARLDTDPARNDGARARPGGAVDYPVLHPDADPRRDYRAICDASGDAGLLDTLIARLAPGGEVVLAGFYADRPSFAFPPAFMREARLRVAAQWADGDLRAVRDLAEAGRLSLDGLITHRADAAEAPDAYRTAFADPGCLKMVLDWRTRP